MPSFSTAVFGFVICYIVYSIWNIVEIFLPPRCSPSDNCLQSYLQNSPVLDLVAFSSSRGDPRYDYDVNFVTEIKNFPYLAPWERSVAIDIPKVTRNNGSLYLHLFCLPSANMQYKGNFTRLFKRPDSVYFRIPMTQMHTPDSFIFNLLQDDPKPIPGGKESQTGNALKPVTHLRGKVGFNMLTEPLSLPSTDTPIEIHRLLRLSQSNTFLPVMVYNFLETRLEDLKQIKNDTEEVILKYAPINIGKLRFVLHVEMAMVSFKKMGFSSKDIDDVKGVFASTNLYLLCGTIVIVTFHILFDVLAFKNDVKFWRHKSNLEGLSSRTVLWRAFSQFVVFLYLLDEKATFIVMAPSMIATAIEFWKALKVLRKRSDTASEAERKTAEYDAESMKYLSYLLYPLCTVGAVYSLIYQPHKSWYSWCIHSLVNGVYAFGFLFMLPQLFVNYRLKSVAALPWRAFMYKAFNTFIDDVFAFIITMPTAHRMACFRDDIIFLVYLYQRWLYPVDKTRLDEAARALGEKAESKKEN